MQRIPLFVPLSILMLVFAGGVIFSLSTGGRADVGFSALFSSNEEVMAILWDIRVPRSLVAILLGVGLALAGLILQAITHNPLASPGILGINQGAAFGLAIALIFTETIRLPADLMATLGAFGAGLLVFLISGGFQGRVNGLRLILSGIAVGAFAYAIVRLAYTLEDDIARTVVRWTIGDITDVRWPAALRLAMWVMPAFLLAVLMAQRFNLLALGHQSAKGLGADPRITLFAGALLAAALAGIAVSIAGPIAFVGLVVPHIAKFIFGGDHRILVPSTAFIGGTLMVYADGLSKIVTPPIEVPVGVMVALIGAPWFLVQAIRAKDF